MAEDDGRHILVCNNVDCLNRGGQQVFEDLHARVAESGVDVDVKQYPCFGGCDYGPNIVFYPDKVFYSGVKPPDLDEMMEHVRGGAPVARLTGHVDPQIEELIFELLDAGLL